jgi:hypothetical protein
VESVWNTEGILSRIPGEFEPRPIRAISPKIRELAWLVRFSFIRHTSARSVQPIKVVFQKNR